MDGNFKRVVSAPAIALEKGIAVTEAIGNQAMERTGIRKAQNFWRGLGPGLITGAADDDPSGIATYSQVGSQYGFQLIWLAGFTFPLMAIVQEMCARLGLVTGRGLAGNIRINYSKWVLYSCAALLFIANTLNVGADIGAMAKATQLLTPGLNFYFLAAVFTLFTLFLQIFTTYENYAKYLKYLVIVMLSYVATAFIVHIDIHDLLIHTFVPSITFSKEQIILITGVLGTTISPYLFFWQTSHEVEEDISHGKTTLQLRQSEVTDGEVKNMRVDVWTGMFLSNMVMYFIIATCAAVLFTNGITNIASAADAAMALRPLAGEQAFLLFALGIVGMGLLGIPTLAGSAAYAVAESFKWRSGLSLKLKQARAFYGVLIVSMLIGFGINLLGLDPIKLLIYSAVANGCIAPIILFLIVKMTSNKKVMHARVNNPTITWFGWVATGLMAIASVGTMISLVL